MKNRGFTLIEVIVAMSIISIMAAILVPMSYKIFETREIEITLERMMALKKAMVGDPAMYQNGIRTDYGFVGDNGDLPAGLDELKPYLAADFDSDTYDQDVWNDGLRAANRVKINYGTTPYTDDEGRNVLASLTSKGPDRTTGGGDDLTVEIFDDEVFSTDVVMGNLAYSVTNPYNAAVIDLVYSAKVTAFLEVGDVVPFASAGCVPVTVGRLEAESYSGPTSALYDSTFPVALHVGKFIFSGELYKNETCSGVPAAKANDLFLFVNSGLKNLYVNLRFPPVVH